MNIAIILGTKPSEWLNRRCNSIIDLYKVWLIQKIICSGKYSFLTQDPWYIEADFISDYLISNWVYINDILKEIESMDTVGNVYFSKIIIENNFPQTNRIYISTMDFHLPRVMYICNQIFQKNANIVYIWSKDIIADLNFDYDQKVIKLYQGFFEEAKDNNTNIYDMLYKYLPWYNNINPIYTKEYIIQNFKS